MQVCEEQIDLLHEQVSQYKIVYRTCKQQRDEAVGESVEKGQPFYFWVLLGLAGGVVLTRGIR